MSKAWHRSMDTKRIECRPIAACAEMLAARTPMFAKNLICLPAGVIGFASLGVIGLGTFAAFGAENSTFQDRARNLPIRGVVRPVAQATISTDIVATVAKVGFKEGQAFKKGDVLVAFDCRRYEAELASAVAQLKEMQVNVDTNAFLEKRDAANKQDLEISKARADKASAEADSLRARIDQCVIEAPFDGRVADLGIREYEMPATGKPLIRILADGELEIDLILPSNWLEWLKPGSEFKFLIDETRKSYDGVVTRIGAAVDTISQTIKVTARFKEPTAEVLPGMSGSARFAHDEG
jgi:membrane fusion protein, multidrug efflux system